MYHSAISGCLPLLQLVACCLEERGWLWVSNSSHHVSSGSSQEIRMQMGVGRGRAGWSKRASRAPFLGLPMLPGGSQITRGPPHQALAGVRVLEGGVWSVVAAIPISVKYWASAVWTRTLCNPGPRWEWGDGPPPPPSLRPGSSRAPAASWQEPGPGASRAGLLPAGWHLIRKSWPAPQFWAASGTQDSFRPRLPHIPEDGAAGGAAWDGGT